MTRPSILVTNDDGVHAPGIKHLWKALFEIADVYVVAPATEQSASGLSITIRHPLRIQEVADWPCEGAKVWSVNGTPADCVKLALHTILPAKPNLIVSGINRGSNAGRNVLYSGTVAAVVEGVLHEVPGIALSMADFYNPCYSSAECYIPPLIQYLLQHPLPSGTILNVNFPETQHGLKGIHLTKQGREFYVGSPEKREHPSMGESYYWLGSKVAEFSEDSDCDISWLREGYATAVPIHIADLTHHSHLEQHKSQFARFMDPLLL